MFDCDVALIGAGPYGLAAAAHLRQIKGLGLRIFGEPMSFWRGSMPCGMLLRSAWSASSIADPGRDFSLDAYKQASGNHLAAPISLERFVEYGLWFQRTAAPEVDRRQVVSIEPNHAGFRLSLSDSQTITASRVIVAVGISAFAFKPPQFRSLPSAFVSHTSEQRDLGRFAGRRVLVIGGGQSALESAALLHELGAQVEVLARCPHLHWLGVKEKLQMLGPLSRALLSPYDVGPAGVSWLVATPSLLARLPRRTQNTLRSLCLRPAGARWLRERMRKVPVTNGKSVVQCTVANEDVQLVLNDGSVRVVDHVLLGTGYRVDVTRYDFLSPGIIGKIRLAEGFPILRNGFESSVSRLHFLGAPAAWSFGPLMYFVSGTKYAASGLQQFFQRFHKGTF